MLNLLSNCFHIENLQDQALYNYHDLILFSFYLDITGKDILNFSYLE